MELSIYKSEEIKDFLWCSGITRVIKFHTLSKKLSDKSGLSPATLLHGHQGNKFIGLPNGKSIVYKNFPGLGTIFCLSVNDLSTCLHPWGLQPSSSCLLSLCFSWTATSVWILACARTFLSPQWTQSRRAGYVNFRISTLTNFIFIWSENVVCS